MNVMIIFSILIETYQGLWNSIRTWSPSIVQEISHIPVMKNITTSHISTIKIICSISVLIDTPFPHLFSPCALKFMYFKAQLKHIWESPTGPETEPSLQCWCSGLSTLSCGPITLDRPAKCDSTSEPHWLCSTDTKIITPRLACSSKLP